MLCGEVPGVETHFGNSSATWRTMASMSASPAQPHPEPLHPELGRLLETVARFRGAAGCAWYEEQTHASLVPYLQEETAELVDAIESGDAADLREELGDVLFQVLFHADVAAAAGEFTLEDVARDQAEKLVRRNPHVFGPTPTRDIDEIIRLWHEAKAVEKAARTSVVDGVAFGMPALALADKLLGKAAQVPGWDEQSELATTDELGLGGDEAADLATLFTSEEELGDALLELVAQARVHGFDAERALRDASRRLAARIRAAEARP